MALLFGPHNLSYNFICNFLVLYCLACHSCGPWGRRIKNVTHKKCLIYRSEYLLIPQLGSMSSALCGHGMRCGWGCLIYSILDTLLNPAPSHFWIALGVLLNGTLWNLFHIRVHIFGSVPVGVEPVFMLFWGIISHPALQRGVEPTCCFSYGLFGHNHVHGGCLPVDIIWKFWIGN